MSVFATLRKRGKKMSSEQEQAFTLGLPAASPLFSSAPNLQKIETEDSIDSAKTTEENQLNQHQDVVDPSSPRSMSDKYWYDHERNQYYRKSSTAKTKYKYLTRKTSLTHSTESCASMPGSASGLSPKLSPNSVTPKSKSSSPSSLRSFVSMVSMASGLRRSKSIRKQAFASAIHLRPSTETDHGGVGITSESESPNTSASRRPSLPPSGRSPTMKSSSSVPAINSRHRKGHRPLEDNREPGVGSSCSSLSSSSGSVVSNQSGLLSVGLGSNSRQNSSSSLDFKRSFGALSSHHDSDSGTPSRPTPEEIERTKLMLQAAKKFNMDPKKGIDFLVLNGLLQRNAEEVAQFLKDGEGLSKSAIGNYLGEHHEFNLEVLQAFVDLHDFSNVLVVQALRGFLWSFRLPGEAQKIDRMMEAFAKRYTLANPDLFANSDTCYLLAFAIIMLNTSLHNPSVKDKPTVESFIRMNRDIDGGKALDRDFIVSLYNSILNEPFAIPPEDGNDLMLTFFNPEIEGWLWKQGGRYKTWKRRWFILSNSCIYYFLFTTDKDPRGIIPLENIVVRKSNEKVGKKFPFVLYKEKTEDNFTDYIKSCKTADGKITAGRHTSYHLATATKTERNNWIRAIALNNSSHDFYSLLARKKNRIETQGNRQPTLVTTSTTLPRTRPHHKPPSPQSLRVRKSQIPRSRPVSGSTSEIPDSLQDPELLSPHPHTLKCKSFSTLSNDSEDSGSSFSVNYPSDHNYEEAEGSDDSDSSHSQISFQAPPLTRRVSEHGSSLVSRRTRSKLGKSMRKFSLPHESKLCETECMTLPGIRISVEDADAEIPLTPSETHAAGSESEPWQLSPVIDCDFEVEEAFVTATMTKRDSVDNPEEQVKLFQRQDKVLYVPLKSELGQVLEESSVIETINEYVIQADAIEPLSIPDEAEVDDDEHQIADLLENLLHKQKRNSAEESYKYESNHDRDHDHDPSSANGTCSNSIIIRRTKKSITPETGDVFVNREDILLKHKNYMTVDELYEYGRKSVEAEIEIQTESSSIQDPNVIRTNSANINDPIPNEIQYKTLHGVTERHTEI